MNTGYCINLAHRADRWSQFFEEARKFPKHFRFYRSEAVYTPDDPRLGCAQSHLNLIKMAQITNMKSIFVVEDDVVFTDTAFDVIQSALSQLPDDWDILLCGGYRASTSQEVVSGVHEIYFAVGTHCLIYNQSSYEKMLSYCQEPVEIDIFISFLAATGKIKLYYICPPVAFQRKGFSDIQQKEFDWDDSDPNQELNYECQRQVFAGLKDKNLDFSTQSALQIKDPYLKGQALVMIGKTYVEQAKSLSLLSA